MCCGISGAARMGPGQALTMQRAFKAGLWIALDPRAPGAGPRDERLPPKGSGGERRDNLRADRSWLHKWPLGRQSQCRPWTVLRSDAAATQRDALAGRRPSWGRRRCRLMAEAEAIGMPVVLLEGQRVGRCVIADGQRTTGGRVHLQQCRRGGWVGTELSQSGPPWGCGSTCCNNALLTMNDPRHMTRR